MSEDYLVRVENLKKHFPLKQGFFQTLFSKEELTVKAVDGISFALRKGEILGLVGESGSGKTTTGRLLVRLTDPTDGIVYFEGKDISALMGRRLRSLRKPEKSAKCSVPGCGRNAKRTVSAKDIVRAGIEPPSGDKGYLCGIHFKEANKRLKARQRLKDVGKVEKGAVCVVAACGRKAKHSVDPGDIAKGGLQTLSPKGDLCNLHFIERAAQMIHPLRVFLELILSQCWSTCSTRHCR